MEEDATREAELLDVVNENNEIQVNRWTTKKEIHELGLWHRAAHVWVFNSKGEILIQLRATGKIWLPSLWDGSVAGHINAGEDPWDGAVREVLEEIGLYISTFSLRKWKVKKQATRFKGLLNNEFWYIAFLLFDGKAEDLKLQEEEVQEVKFITPEGLRKELQDNPEKYTPLKSYWLEVIDEILQRT